MRSKTSYCNRALYLQGIRRSWPLGAVFLLVNLFTVLFPLARSLQSLISVDDRIFSMRFFLKDFNWFDADGLVVSSLVMGLLTASLCFLWMFSRRSSGFHLTLPVKREGLFLSFYLSGLSMILIPLLITFAGLLAVTGHYGILNPSILFSWLGTYAAMTGFFYSLAVLCAALTGHALAMGALFGLCNVLFAGLHLLGSAYLQRTVYDASSRIFPDNSMSIWDKLSPIVWLTSHRNIGGYPWILAVTAILLAGLSLLLFKRRRSESAGNGLAAPWLRSVLLYLAAFGTALAGSLILLYSLLPYPYMVRSTLLAPLFAVLSAAVGFFAVIRIQHKSFKAWKGRKKALILSLSLVFLLSLGLEFDWFGVERWTPADSEVVSVSVNVNYNEDIILEQPDSIALVTALHREIVENLSPDNAHFMAGEWPVSSGMWPKGLGNYRVRMIYTLKDGRVRTCTYNAIVNITEKDSLYQRFFDLCGSREFIDKHFYKPEFAADNIFDVSYDYRPAEIEYTEEPVEVWQHDPVIIEAPADQQVIYAALYEDIAAGRLPALRDVTHTLQRNEREHIISITFSHTEEQTEYGDYKYYSFAYSITPECVSTLAVLKELGIDLVWSVG